MDRATHFYLYGNKLRLVRSQNVCAHRVEDAYTYYMNYTRIRPQYDRSEFGKKKQQTNKLSEKKKTKTQFNLNQ